MLPSLAQLSLSAAPVAMLAPARTWLFEDLPHALLNEIFARLMTGSPDEACKTLFDFCASANGLCGEKDDPKKREAVYRRACMQLFGADGEIVSNGDRFQFKAEKDVFDLFGTWKNGFGLLCMGFSPERRDVMHRVLRTGPKTHQQVEREVVAARREAEREAIQRKRVSDRREAAARREQAAAERKAARAAALEARTHSFCDQERQSQAQRMATEAQVPVVTEARLARWVGTARGCCRRGSAATMCSISGFQTAMAALRAPGMAEAIRCAAV